MHGALRAKRTLKAKLRSPDVNATHVAARSAHANRMNKKFVSLMDELKQRQEGRAPSSPKGLLPATVSQKNVAEIGKRLFSWRKI